MNKTYIQTVTTIKARCRNKRLREAGAGGGNNSVVKSIIEANSGSSTNHTHDNKSDLDKLSVSDGYLNITDYEKQEDGSEIKKTNKVKAGFADEATNATSWAGHLFDAFWQSITDMFSALPDEFISKDKDDSTPYSLGIGKDLTVEGSSTLHNLTATTGVFSGALSSASAVIAGLITAGSLSTNAATISELNSSTIIATENVTSPLFIGDLQGKLHTPRAIWGQYFDGSGDVNGTLVNNVYGTSFNVLQSLDGDDHLYGQYIEYKVNGNIIHRLRYDANHIELFNNSSISVNTNGCVGINNNSPVYGLDINGTLHAAGSATLDSTLHTVGAATFDSNLTAAGLVTANGGAHTTTLTATALSMLSDTYILGDAQLYARIMSPDFASQTKGWGITRAGAADFRNIYADELRVQAFTADISQALAGSDYLTKSVSKLSANFVIPAVGNTERVIVDDIEGMPATQCFVNGDYIRFRAFNRTAGLIVANAWGTVTLDTTYGTGGFLNGTQAYIFTCTATTGAGLTVYKGNEVLDYGTSGSGMIARTTLDAMGSPYEQIATWVSDPSNSDNYTVHARLGNLNGLSHCSGYGLYSDNVFLTNSILVGDLTKAGNYLSFDTVNGLVIKLGGTSVATTSDVSSSLSSANEYTDTAKNAAISTAAGDATTKANAAQSNAISSANTIAQGYATTAQENAANDATTKANSALYAAQSYSDNNLTVAKSYTDTQVTIVNGSITAAITTTRTYADNVASNAQTNAINSASVDATNKVNNIQIGGTNLRSINGGIHDWTIGGSSGSYTNNYSAGYKYTNATRLQCVGSWQFRFDLTHYITNAGYYSLSFWYKCLSNCGACSPQINDKTLGATIDINQSTDWKFFSSFINVDHLIGEYGFIDFEFSDTSDILISDLTIIEGNKPALTYITSPEDVDASISNAQNNAVSQAATNAAALYVTQSVYSAQVSILTDSISSKVSQTDFNALGTRVGTAESNITQNATAIATKVSQSDFNALGTRVTTAETNITQQSNSITAQATSISDLTGRMSTAEAKITPDAINLTVLSQTQNYANTAQSNAISAAATDATNKVNSVQVGGVNLLLNSQNALLYSGDFPAYFTTVNTLVNGFYESVVTSTQSDDTRSYSYGWFSDRIVSFPITNQDYMLSFDYKTNSNTGIIQLDIRDADNYNVITFSTGLLPNTNGVWTRGYFKCNWTITSQTKMLLQVTAGTTINDYVGIRKLKWEIGNKATSYSPAPEDMVDQVSYAANLQILNNSISAKVAQTDFDTLAGRVSTSESNIIQNATNINLKVSKDSIISSINQTAESVTINASKINLTSAITFSSLDSSTQNTINGKADTSTVNTQVNDAISTAASDATNKVNNIQIGGRNLIAGSSLSEYTASYPNSGCQDYQRYISTEILKCTQYVMSFWAKSTVANDKIRCYFYGPNTTIHGLSSQGTSGYYADGLMDITLSTIWTHYWIVYTTDGTDSSLKNCIFMRLFSGEGSGIISMKGCKLESGTKATDWSPAPEDVDASISASIATAGTNAAALYVSKTDYSADLSITNSAIQAKVSQTDYDSNNTVISNRFSTVEQTASGISTRVTTAQSTADTIQTDLTNYKSTVASTYSTITQTSNSIAVAISSVETYADNSSSTAQSNAISTAATDATNKSNSALSSAKSYTDTQITAVNGTISLQVTSVKTYADNAASTAQSNAISAAATDATTKANSAYAGAVATAAQTSAALYVSKTSYSSDLAITNTAIQSKVSQTAYDANNILIANQFTEIKQTSDSISLKVNSDGFVNYYPLAVYGKVTKETYYTFGIGQDGEFAAVCSTFTGLLVGKKYVAKVTLKNIDCVSGATLDNYISASAPSLSSYNNAEDYEVTDYNELGEIYIEFTATASTMYVGFITGSDGWTNNTGGYCHIDIHNISLFYDNVKNKLLSVGIDIDNNKIIETADTLLIRDSSGNVNTIFDTINGKPVMKSQYIQTQDLDVSGTFSERYSFVNRGTLNVINFSTLNNVAVNRGIDTTPAVVVLPMFSAYAGGNFNTTAFQKAGTNISIQNSYNVNVKNWKEAATLLNGSGKSSLRYQLAASAVIIVSDPRIIAYNNYVGSTPLIYPDGQANANDSIEYRKGRMFCNGKSARIAMILPGQTLRLQSGIETYNGTSYLVWYVVNASEYTSVNKGLQIIGANSMFGSANAGVLSFYASNTYSNWGEGGTYDTDFLIAPKELDAWVGGQAYASEDPSIVLDCSSPESDTLFYINER